jgi:hypothetical protein
MLLRIRSLFFRAVVKYSKGKGVSCAIRFVLIFIRAQGSKAVGEILGAGSISKAGISSRPSQTAGSSHAYPV